MTSSNNFWSVLRPSRDRWYFDKFFQSSDVFIFLVVNMSKKMDNLNFITIKIDIILSILVEVLQKLIMRHLEYKKLIFLSRKNYV